VDQLEQRVRDVLHDDRLDLLPAVDAVAAVHRGVRRRRRRTRITAAAAGVAAAAATAAIVIAVPSALQRHGSSPRIATSPVSRSWSVGGPIALPDSVTAVRAVTASGGLVWVAGPEQLVRVDPASGITTSYGAGAAPVALAATPSHLWVVTADPAGCVLVERDAATGTSVESHPVPCAPGAPVAVTANGQHAWLVTANGATTVVRRFTAGAAAVTRALTLDGIPAGARPLAIAGPDVFVLTRSDNGGGDLLLSRLSGADLVVTGTLPLSANVGRLAYSTRRVLMAGADGVFATDTTLGRVVKVAPDDAGELSTGHGVAWLLADNSPTASRLLALDAASGTRLGAVVLGGDVSAVVADDQVVWAAVQPDGGRPALVAIRPSTPG
jgi:hypothetical protein